MPDLLSPRRDPTAAPDGSVPDRRTASRPTRCAPARPAPDNGGTRYADGVARVEQALRTRLADGTYPVRTWLPSQRALMAEFGVSGAVVQTVAARMIADKLIASFSSVGTYVLDPAAPAAVPAGLPAGRSPDRTDQDRAEGILRARIADGTYTVCTKIPPFARLSEELGIPLWKVRQAVRRLADAGLMVTLMGLGTVVTDPRAPSAESAHRVSVGGGGQETWTILQPGVTNAAHIRAVVTKRLTDGTYPPGARLPTLKVLADEFGVSNVVVQKALGQLKRKQLLLNHVSQKGLFAAPAPEQKPSSGVLPDRASA
ncbi:GntR family transcriptional regulator [Streptomyces sp. NPDC000878]